MLRLYGWLGLQKVFELYIMAIIEIKTLQELEERRIMFIPALLSYINKSQSTMDFSTYWDLLKESVGKEWFTLIVNTDKFGFINAFAFLELHKMKLGQPAALLSHAYVKKSKKLEAPIWKEGINWIQEWARKHNCYMIIWESQNMSKVFQRFCRMYGFKPIALVYGKVL